MRKYSKSHEANRSIYAGMAELLQYSIHEEKHRSVKWMATDTISSDIKNKRRMTGTWYAGSGGGSSAWESVEGFWSYVTSNTSNGPRATGYNNGKNYTGVSAGSIGVGNVLQMRGGTSGNYTHSVYVYNCTAPITYSSITVMQHTSNKKRAVQDIINTYGSNLCMRRLAFKTTTFAN